MANDTISRQAAIDAIERLVLPQTKGETMAEEINRVAWRCAINCAEEMIGHLPSAERRGRWINGNEGNWNAVIVPKCSICGETFYEMNVNINGEYTYNYCPNCGARMEAAE